jgi:predicted unusual protein kinase regulating ubiquinone biosynthesis (AarF/ABC1/UbiB family)
LIQVLWTLSGLVIVLLLRGSSSDADVQRGLAHSILNTLTGLGPCFIKLGQALSTRPDLVRRDWLEELTRLQDDLPAFPHSIALSRIEKELGAPADQLFEEFPSAPIAAASLGQVYKARLEGQSWVAVKVQRPNLTFILRRDLVLIRALGVLTAPFLPLNLGFGLGSIIEGKKRRCEHPKGSDQDEITTQNKGEIGPLNLDRYPGLTFKSRFINL